MLWLALRRLLYWLCLLLLLSLLRLLRLLCLLRLLLCLKLQRSRPQGKSSGISAYDSPIRSTK